MTRTLLTLAVLATLATPAHAQGNQLDRNIMLQGAGTALCSTITDLYRRYPHSKPQIDIMVISWAGGFMTSGNLARQVQGKDSRDLGAMTVDQQTRYLQLWCQARPGKHLMDAVFELFATFPSNNDAAVVEQGSLR